MIDFNGEGDGNEVEGLDVDYEFNL